MTCSRWIPALGYGLGEFARMLQAMEAAGYSRSQLFPHGGHMIALHVVVGLGLGGSEAYPGVFAPVGGYAPDCTLEDGGIAPGPLPASDWNRSPTSRRISPISSASRGQNPGGRNGALCGAQLLL